VKFRDRIGKAGITKLFALSVVLHGREAEEETVLVDTTVQEKAITYPTDSKPVIKMPQGTLSASGIHLVINRLNKLAKTRGIKQRRIIVGILLRELQRKLSETILEQEAERFTLYELVLAQQPKDKNKIYSLYEPDV